jgi:hypothetical protein
LFCAGDSAFAQPAAGTLFVILEGMSASAFG